MAHCRKRTAGAAVEYGPDAGCQSRSAGSADIAPCPGLWAEHPHPGEIGLDFGFWDLGHPTMLRFHSVSQTVAGATCK
jgi:hypothetical protein